MELIIENIRCFSGLHYIPIKPLTLLTGENSSGKSTFLAMLSIALDRIRFPFRPRFNEAPFNLGNFDTIATFKNSRTGGRADSFALGYKLPLISSGTSSLNYSFNNCIEMVSTYTGQKGYAELSNLDIRGLDLSVKMIFSGAGNNRKLDIKVVADGYEESFIFPEPIFHELSNNPGLDDYLLFAIVQSNIRRKKDPSLDNELMGKFSRLLHEISQIVRAQSIAPIRSKPKRTYDQVQEDFSPEGDHIPFVLTSLLDDPAKKDILDRFGHESGLYNKLSIKNLGNSPSDPRQVMIANSGRLYNLIDVGYGVSQVLPVIVQGVLSSKNNILLLQQPEVHLHPRAQAALGTFFVDLMNESRKQFVIETHSDYIIDRIRQEVAKGRLQSDKVEILYFEKKNNETKIYPISIDDKGDIKGAPRSYREFFMKEEVNFFNRNVK